MQDCCPVSRRSFLRIGLTASAAAAAGLKVPLLAQDTVTRRGKAVILLWMGGGPSQIDTWDPKPGQKTGGPFKAIDTSVRGVQIAEHLPRIARQAHHLAILRSVTTAEAAHERGAYLMHTCFSPIPGQDFAAMGTIVASELTPKGFPLPAFLAVSPPAIPQTPAFADEFQPFTLAGWNSPIANVARPRSVSPEREERRRRLLKEQNAPFEEPRRGRLIEKVRSAVAKAEDLMTTPLLKAFDIRGEPEALRKAYGGGFGLNCLLARRLVEAGVPFVEIGLEGWDTHGDNFNQVERLCRQELDPGMGTLVRDLDQRGLLKDTIVLWMGEFGRTPAINGGNGRDHWCRCFSVVMAGGGVGGRVICATDKTGMDIAHRPVPVSDLFASVYRLAGIEENKTYVINNRYVKYSDKGRPLRELF